MLGPVTSHSRSSSERPQSLATKRAPAARKRFLDHRVAAALDLEAVVAGEAGPATSRLPPPARRARRRRRAGRARRRRRRSARPGQRRSRSAPRDAPASAASAWAPAWPTRIACSCRSGALKRTTPARVWRWVKPEFRRHQRVGMPGRHLDMEAEHAVVADLERRDSGLLRGSAPRARRWRGGPRRRWRADRPARRHSPRRYSRPARRRSAATAPARARAGRSARHGRSAPAAARRATAADRRARASRVVQAPRLVEPVAQLAEVARRRRARRPAGPAPGRYRAAPCSCRRSQSREPGIAFEQGDEIEPRLDRRRGRAGARRDRRRAAARRRR